MVRNELRDWQIESEQGQTMAEYGIALSVITIGILTLIGVLSDRIMKSIERAIALIP
jgi:Flp pilus assembly pilin Flp